MAEKLDPKEIVSFKELLMANSIQVDAIAQLLVEKGFFTKEEFFAKLCLYGIPIHYNAELTRRSALARHSSRGFYARNDVTGGV